MKTVMILGAAYTQVPLYQAAARLGVRTVAASIPGAYPGFELADVQEYVNIADPEAVVAAARRQGVDGIATCGLDLGMRAIGAAAEALSLPGPSAGAALKASNKYRMKQAFERAGVSTARFVRVCNEAEVKAALQELGLPVAVKAVDLMGGRGIYRCDTEQEALEAFRRSLEASSLEYCLVEEFIEGTLFGTEGMIQNGRFLFLLPNNTEAWQGAVPMPLGHSVPLKFSRSAEDTGGRPDDEALAALACDEVQKAARALGLDNCPLNCDLICRDGQVYVVELTGRSGATGLSELCSIYYGVDYYEAILRLSLGEDLSNLFAHPRHLAVLTRTFASERGGIVSRICDENPHDGLIDDLSFNVGPGDEVRPYTNGRDRIGQAIIHGESLSELEGRFEDIREHIRIDLEGDLPVIVTPIVFLREDERGNRLCVKREDLHPYSFGGNKVRFADAYLRDMQAQGCDALVIYGGYGSNLCRILAAACHRRSVPCSMVHNIDDGGQNPDGLNARLIRSAQVREYPCHKGEIHLAVQQALDDFSSAGRRPYYIHGDIYGRGHAHIPMRSCERMYDEILRQEQEMGRHFTHLFLASSTNLTQAGLIAGHIRAGDTRRIVGISVTRGRERARRAIREHFEDYLKAYPYALCGRPDGRWQIRSADELPEEEILIEDGYLAGGYGCCDEAVQRVIRREILTSGMPLDPVYTGKAFRGMEGYVEAHDIHGEDLLFIHTGGLPLFTDFVLNQS